MRVEPALAFFPSPFMRTPPFPPEARYCSAKLACRRQVAWPATCRARPFLAAGELRSTSRVHDAVRTTRHGSTLNGAKSTATCCTQPGSRGRLAALPLQPAGGCGGEAAPASRLEGAPASLAGTATRPRSSSWTRSSVWRATASRPPASSRAAPQATSSRPAVPRSRIAWA